MTDSRTLNVVELVQWSQCKYTYKDFDEKFLETASNFNLFASVGMIVYRL